MARRYRFEGTNTYELELRIDEIVDDDIFEPIVLVKEYRNDQNKQSHVDLLFMPRLNPNEDLTDVGGSSELEGCIIDGDEVDVNDSKAETP